MKPGELYFSTHLSCMVRKQEGEAPGSRQISFGVRRSAFDVRLSLLFLFTLALLFLSLGSAKAQVSREYQLKAVFLYNFAQFTDWPTNTLADDKSPIVIGIIGPDPFGSALEETIRNETVGGHPLSIQHYSSPADIKTCHILFITQPEIRHVDEILKAIDGKPVLTVSDADNPAAARVMIRFAVENNKVHFRINTDAARAANVSLSSKLLRVAEATPSRRTAP
jgi:hypothetical protein